MIFNVGAGGGSSWNSALNKLGAKNLIPYPYDQMNKTDKGITFTVNENGSINANGTFSGTTGQVSQIYPIIDDNVERQGYNQTILKMGETYTFSGCPKGGSSKKYTMRIITNYPHRNTGYTSKTYTDYGDGVTFTVDHEILSIRIMVDVFMSVENLVFYPMIRYASISDDTYEPYAMTNRELTESVDELNESLANGEISFSVIDGEPYVKVGADTPRPFRGAVELLFSSLSVNQQYVNGSGGVYSQEIELNKNLNCIKFDVTGRVGNDKAAGVSVVTIKIQGLTKDETWEDIAIQTFDRGRTQILSLNNSITNNDVNVYCKSLRLALVSTDNETTVGINSNITYCVSA